MNRILVLFAHPALENSRIQKHLLKAANDVDGIYVHDLYENYPDFMIDVEREQQFLLNHDVILFQHPFYWYSAPALIKEWMDLVLEYDFAYGKNGTALEGKYLGNVISAGGSRTSYQQRKRNGYTVRELIRPFEQSAHLCSMEYLPPFAVHDTHDLSDSTIHRFAADYQEQLRNLQQHSLNSEELLTLPYLNDWKPEAA